MRINEVAKLTGVTIRTLHYYDEIGLLKPSEITEAGYRLYDSAALETLQQILFFRELDFSLNDIKGIMTNPYYNKAEALTKHKELLLQKRNRIDNLINLVDNTLKGEDDMSFKQFDMTEIEANKKKYAAEVKERWGDTTAYAESEEKTGSYDEAQWRILSGEGKSILQEFGKNRDIQPDSKEAQDLVKKWQEYISANFYTCTKEILSCLGVMYIGDERFTQNIDQNGEGTAAFMAAAIEVFCTK
ncbi:MAG: MerR family transcriptional regulator [Clostridiaceae bacterium]|nr:MerR family transcriptional regulator [Clostridiaceae bacterium]